ncbi:hypothetical protein [Kutzneria buriramensis]|uniref:Uncharacterized protein n=1 Tax=Kutzneria buriramensis TaxID=1045776 RepID=A0A3E0GST2_9PSEU|nr:hypothetical protein [Kutzneria buriramensis]REH26193.1 hypothetical protein BCF44_13448 [Kutzneria buriramensis]
MNRDISPLLGVLDPAPPRALTVDEQARQEQLLSSVLADARVVRRRPVRRIALAGALAVGAAAAVVVAPVAYHMIKGGGGPLSSTAISSWTGNPVRLAASSTDSTAQQFCEKNATGNPNATGPFTVSNADLRGEVTSMVLTRGKDITLCMVGTDGEGFTMAVDPIGKIAPKDITLDTAGSHGDGDSAFSYVEGFAGADVKSISVHDGSRTADALVDGGRWTVWWPGTSDFTGTVTVTTTDGNSHSVRIDSLFH